MGQLQRDIMRIYMPRSWLHGLGKSIRSCIPVSSFFKNIIPITFLSVLSDLVLSRVVLSRDCVELVFH